MRNLLLNIYLSVWMDGFYVGRSVVVPHYCGQPRLNFHVLFALITPMCVQEHVLEGHFH